LRDGATGQGPFGFGSNPHSLPPVYRPRTAFSPALVNNPFFFKQMRGHSLALGVHFPAPEILMLLLARDPMITLHRVEISGWDAGHEFFVEKCELEWNEETGKHVLLNHALPERAMIFVRLLEELSPERGLPVPFEAIFTCQTADGRREFMLRQAHPREEHQGNSTVV